MGLSEIILSLCHDNPTKKKLCLVRIYEKRNIHT